MVNASSRYTGLRCSYRRPETLEATRRVRCGTFEYVHQFQTNHTRPVLYRYLCIGHILK